MNNEEKFKQENNFLKEMIRKYYIPEMDRLKNTINEAIEYIDKCKTLSISDKKIILSISLLENILKGDSND